MRVLKKESLKIFNYNFELLGVISDYESFIYQRYFREAGSYELHINKYKNNVDKLSADTWLMLGKHKEKCFIIESISENFNDNKETVVIKGTDLKGLTKRRITYTNNFDRVENTQAENIMKHYITNHFIDSKLEIEPYTPLVERNMEILEVAETQNRGIETVWQSRFENVHDVEKHIAEDTGLGWTVYADLNKKKFVFDILVQTNRTLSQNSVPQIVFSKSKKNLKESSRYLDLSGFKNVGYIGGKGENEDRPIVVIGTETGINRREVFVDLSNISDMDELNLEGDKKLKEYNIINSLDGQVYSIDNMEYGVDWFLGDKVNVEEQEKEITGIKEIYERNNMDIEVTFGNKIPNLIDELNKKKGVVK